MTSVAALESGQNRTRATSENANELLPVASGERFDTLSNAPSSRLAGYALLNLRGSYAFSPAYTVSVRWNNVLDKQYELVRGYNTPGANVFVSVEYTRQ